MRKSGFSLLSLVVGLCAVPTVAFAEDAPAAPAAPAPGAPTPAGAAPSNAAGVNPAAPEPTPAPATTPSEPAPGPAAAPADAAPPAITYPNMAITGYVESAWHRGLVSHADSYKQLPTHIYDAGDGFQLHAMHLSVHSAVNEHVSATIDIDAGSDAAFNNGSAFTANRTLFDIQEAYAQLTESGFTLTVGKFATYEGIELIEGPTDPTLTRGLLYGYAEPITHVGAKLHYTTAMYDIGVGLVNGWDTNGTTGVGAAPTGPAIWTADNNNNKTLIWRIGVTPDPMFWAGFSGTYGVEKPGQDTDPRLSLDLTGAIIPSPMLTINFQGNYGSEKHDVASDPVGAPTVLDKSASWWGLGLQPVVHMDAASLGARLEYFKDTNGARVALADDTGYLNLTLTPGYTFYNAFTVRGEFRYDHATKAVLANADKGQTQIGIGAHYVF